MDWGSIPHRSTKGGRDEYECRRVRPQARGFGPGRCPFTGVTGIPHEEMQLHDGGRHESHGGFPEEGSNMSRAALPAREVPRTVGIDVIDTSSIPGFESLTEHDKSEILSFVAFL